MGFFFPNAISAQSKKNKIKLVHANSLEYDYFKGIKAKRLIGNVSFEHDQARMFCDSAWMFNEVNKLLAFGRVVIKEGDSLTMYGDSLRYYGNTKIAHIRGNIRLKDGENVLNTKFLDYDMNTDKANYWDGGVITGSSDNFTLTSERGYYNSVARAFFFQDSVKLVQDDYVVTTDSLKYNTQSKKSIFLGPTFITSSNNKVYCEKGWYNSDTGVSNFAKNARIDTDGQVLKGDSILYYKDIDLGKAYGNVVIDDTAQKIIITGDFAIHNKTDSISIVTGNALLTQFYKTDTLFLHGDTLKAYYDSTGEHQILLAFNHVKFFKSDFQGACDSLIFNDADSTINLFKKPVIWSGESQMTGEYIQIKTYEGIVDNIWFEKNAFIASREDSLHFNQIKGKNMKGYFVKNELNKIHVIQKGQSIYFAKEDDGGVFSMNKAECSDMNIYINEKEIKSISFYDKPIATLTPLKDVKASNKTLVGFKWMYDKRPSKKEDVLN